jgi:hypothetical protein
VQNASDHRLAVTAAEMIEERLPEAILELGGGD